MDYVLRTNALCKKYKDFKALNGLSMNGGCCRNSIHLS